MQNMADEKMVKGALINGYLKFVKKKWGVAGLGEVKRHVGIDGNIKDGKWVPVSTAVEILEWIQHKKGDQYVVAAGKHAMKDLGVFKYIIATFMSIETFIKRAKSTYDTLFNYGAIIIEDSEHGAVITLKDSRDTEASCLSWKGALEGIMEITRTKGEVKTLTPDVPEDCKFEMRWK